jgi:Concanavalin A-like lectin/glucanases superfamily
MKMKPVQIKFLKTILAASCFASFLVGNAHATVTNVAYWRGGENDFPEAPQGSRFTVDIAGTNNLQPWNNPQSTAGWNTYGPYYFTPANYTVGVNATRAPGSTVDWAFDVNAGNTFFGPPINANAGNANWGIQCYNANQDNNGGGILFNGTDGGYGLFIYNGRYSGILNGIAILQGTVVPDGNWHNIALVNDNGIVKLFIDGVLDVSAPLGGSLPFTANDYFTIGSAKFSQFASGSIDEVRLFTFEVGAFSPADLLNYVPVPPGTVPILNYTNVGGGQLQFSWTGSGILQSQTNSLSAGLGTNWVDYPGGGTSPVTVPVDASQGSVFFRVKQ